MATNQELITSINEQVATINKGASKAGLQTLTPLSPITPQAISENPTPIDVVPPPVPQTIEAFQGQVAQPQADQVPQSFADQQTQKVEQFGSDAEQNFESYIMAQLQAPTFSEVTAQQYEEQGVDRLQKKVNQYDLQIVDEQRRLRREQAQIRENRQGLFGGAMQSRLLEASRNSIEQQADLGMLRAFAQNDYLAAKTTADRAIDAITDQNQKFVDALKANYERSQDLFTTAQSREFQVKLADYERQQNKAISDAKLLQETKLQAMQMAQVNGAPQSVLEAISSSQTPEEVISMGGQWGSVDMLERAIKDQQYTNALISGEKAQLELNLLKNPVATDVSPVLLKKIDGLSDGSRQNLIDSRRTVQEVDRMIELVNSVGDMSLLTRATPEGREFLRLRADVTDRLARQRTGAVVGKDEESTFKDILGVGAFNLISSDDQQVIQGLTEFKSTHENSLNLIDPTGEISAFMDARSLNGKDAKEIEAVWGVPASTTSTFNPSSYY